MKKRVLILLILTAIWTLGSWWYYTCKIKGFCGTTNKDLNATSPAAAIATPTAAIETTDPKHVLDSDGDGLTDDEENALELDPKKTDSDGDGVPDNEEVGSDPSSPIDTDGDGIIDALDADDDNDNLPTLLEHAIGTFPLQKDTDGDGLNDDVEVGNNSGVPLDTDGDKLINAIDPDDDNDGLPTIEEKALGTDPLNADSNSNGITDDNEINDVVDEIKPPKNDDVPTAQEDTNTSEDTVSQKASTPEDAVEEEKATDDEVTIESIPDASNASIQGSLLYFPFSSAEPKLSASVSEYFAQVASWLKESSGNNVVLIGHTDDVGSKSNNHKLGLKRAIIVKNMLIKQGAPNSQISATSKGETKPLMSNKTDAGRKKNRRVELTLSGKDVQN